MSMCPMCLCVSKKHKNDLQRIKNAVPLQSQKAKIAQLVEHNLAKVRVAGSSPVFRSRRSSHF